MLQPDVCSPWPVKLCCDTEGVEQADIDRWTAVASQILFRLSGRRWGPSCPYTVRPCRRSCLDDYPLTVGWSRGIVGTPWIPYIGTDGAWRNASVCGCSTDCSCGELCELYLPGPVYDIVSVQDGTVALEPEAYRVDNGSLLVRTDGACWDGCYDLAAPCGTEGTLCVTYRVGLPLDESAIAAVSELTCHLLKGCGGKGSCGCRANQNVTRMVRQGVEIEKADPTLIYSEGRTGLAVVDMWLAAVNPYRLTSPSRVYSPDFKRPRLTT
ncbi:hypothetical protein [Streptomyces sp. NRRL S-350]|uniref:hypothetical protein n=1 Tax=Streptomyces sp. NRRL S-350 TaxID=1463902 RepID=UPI0004C19AFE|nr:hypothetical protein [Streptomyces sp. NRRL S-350]